MARTPDPISAGTCESARVLRQVRYLYSEYCNALLHYYYYGRRLSIVRYWNTTLEILVAVGTSSAVGAWAVWDKDRGQVVWATLAGIAALLALLKPILQFSKQIERYSRLFTGYSDAYYDLDLLVAEVAVAEDYTESVDKRLREIHQRMRELATEDDPTPRQKVVKKLRSEVKRIRPRSYFWWPEKEQVQLERDEAGESEAPSSEARSSRDDSGRAVAA